jgi:hypothetical protein
MNRLRITLEGDRASFEPGEAISGSATWVLLEPPESIELRLFWYTVGKGDQDVEVVERIPMEPTQEGSGEFQLTLPQKPFSFSGKLISIIWAFELVASPGAVTERFEITLGPGRQEVRVDASEG